MPLNRTISYHSLASESKLLFCFVRIYLQIVCLDEELQYLLYIKNNNIKIEEENQKNRKKNKYHSRIKIETKKKQRLSEFCECVSNDLWELNVNHSIVTIYCVKKNDG